MKRYPVYASDESMASAIDEARPSRKPRAAKGKANGQLKAEAPTKKLKTVTQPKRAKAKATRAPRTLDPAKLDAFGLRKGSLKSQAAAMYASKRGATLAEVKQALDSIQFNVLKQLEAKGIKVARVVEKAKGSNREVTRFRIIK
jgi:hypothetical protein